MTSTPKIEDRLEQLGAAQTLDSPEQERKQGIKARLFGDTPPPARRIGRFVDLGALGQGAMGMVRRAYDEQLAREVAVKLVRRRKGRRVNDRMLREAQALAQLSHPNVVQIYEVGQRDGEIFIAMELVDGEPLDRWQHEPRPWRECLEVYVQAGRGLAAAHEAGLVHRDFKPSNCIRDPKGRVRVLDFGLARALEPAVLDTPNVVSIRSTFETASSSDSAGWSGTDGSTMLQKQLTVSNAVVGTIAYMAPEQFAGRASDARSDQFSFCVALCEAIYGEPPFGRDPRRALISMSGGGEQSPAMPSSPAVPARVQQTLRRGLAGDPDARWPSMEALLERLERALRPAPRRQVALVGALLLGTVGVTAMALGGSEEPCTHVSDQLGTTWGEEQRDTIEASLAATGLPYSLDSWNTALEPKLSEYATQLEDGLYGTCMYAVHGSSGSPPANPRCLQRHLERFDDVVQLLSSADVTIADRAASLVANLPPIDACMGGSTQPAEPPVDPDDMEQFERITHRLDHVRNLTVAARYEDGREEGAKAVAEANELGVRLLQAEASLVYGRLLAAAGQREAARAELSTAERLALHGNSDELVVGAKANLSTMAGGFDGDLEQARRDASYAIDLAHREHVTPQTRALAYASRGELRRRSGDLTGARDDLETALANRRDNRGERDPQLVTPMVDLAKVYLDLGEPDRAAELLEPALQIERTWLGDEHPDTTLTISALAAARHRQGQHSEARDLYDEAIGLLEARRDSGLGSDAELNTLAAAHHGRAAVLEDDQKYDAAEREFRAAIGLWTKIFEPAHPDVLHARYGLAAALRHRNSASAIEQLELIVQLVDGHGSPEHLTDLSCRALRDLGRIYYDHRDLPRAEDSFRTGLARLPQGEHGHDLLEADLLNRLGRVVLERGDAPQAQRLHLDAAAIYRSDPGASPRTLARTEYRLARALAAQQQRRSAVEAIERALQVYRRESTPSADRHFSEARRLRDELDAAR